MLLALTTNNLGMLWVAMEAATLTTVLLVTRVPHAGQPGGGAGSTSSCAASASPRRCSAPYCCIWPPRRCSAPEGARCCGPTSTPVKGATRTRGHRRWRSPSCWSATAPRWAWRRCTTGCPMPTPRARRRSPRYCRDCCSMWRMYAVVRCKVLVEGSLHVEPAGQHADGLWPAIGGGRGVLPVATARRQAPVRVFLDRAHGHRSPSPSAWAVRSPISPHCCT